MQIVCRWHGNIFAYQRRLIANDADEKVHYIRRNVVIEYFVNFVNQSTGNKISCWVPEHLCVREFKIHFHC